MKGIYSKTSRYEKYITGKLDHDAAIWFATHAKYDPNETKIDVREKSFEPKYFLEGPLNAAKTLRENNIPFEVIGSKNIRDEKAGVMILSHVANIREEEMDDIEAYVKAGGNLLISGPIANPRLQKMLGVRVIGKTAHNFTYMSPTEAGAELFAGFTKRTPLTIDMHQIEIEVEDDTDMTVLATLTLPYTMTDTYEFAAIHSNPPGIYTDRPCAILKKVGDSSIIWTAAPIEMARPYMSRQVFRRMVKLLAGEPTFTSNAPKFVEVLKWQKDGADYFAVINEQEESPIAPMYDITIDVKAPGKRAYLLPDGGELPTEEADGMLRIHLPKLEVFHMLEVR